MMLARVKFIRQILLPGLVALGLLGALVWIAGLRSLREALRQITFFGLGLAVSAYALTWVCRTLRLWLFTARRGIRLGVWVLFRVSISAFALNSVLPARIGDAAHVLYLNMWGVELGRAVAMVAQLRVLDFAALALSSLPAFCVLAIAGKTPSWVVSSLLLCLLFVALPGAVVWLEGRTSLFGYLEKQIQKRASRFIHDTFHTGREILIEYRAIVRDWPLWFATLGVSLAVALGEGLTTWTVARTTAAEVSFPAALFAFSVASVGKSATITPGGIGVYEGVFAAVLLLFGVDFELALVIAILDHGLKKSFNVLIGLPAAALQRTAPNNAVKSRTVPAAMAAPQQVPE